MGRLPIRSKSGESISTIHYLINSLERSILTRDNGFLNELLLEAKKEYLAAEEHNISVFISSS